MLVSMRYARRVVARCSRETLYSQLRQMRLACLLIDHQGVTREEGVFTLVIIHYIFAHVLSLSYKTARKL